MLTAPLLIAALTLAADLPATLPAPDRPAGSPPRVVYQGTLSANGGHYDLRELFRAAVAGGVRLDVYPSRPSPEYRELAETCPGLRLRDQLESGVRVGLQRQCGQTVLDRVGNRPNELGFRVGRGDLERALALAPDQYCALVLSLDKEAINPSVRNRVFRLSRVGSRAIV